MTRDHSHAPSPSCVVAIADAEVREALAAAIREFGVDVIAGVTDAEALILCVRDCHPSVVVVGARLTGGGIYAASQVARHSPQTATIVLSPDPSREEFFDALSANAVGYLPMSTPRESIGAAVHGVLEGEVAFTRLMTAQLLDELRMRPSHRTASGRDSSAKLTSREWDVAALMRSGASTEQIAARLFMSSSTVRVHISSILHKLQAPDRPTAIRVLAGI